MSTAQNEECPIVNLPTEILLNIFFYLDSIDIISLSEVCEYYRDICADRRISGEINLCLEYRLNESHFKKFIITPRTKPYITVLNINCVFWIPSKTLRQAINKLIHLEELYVLDTGISLTIEDGAMYKNIKKVKKIAITITSNTSSPEVYDAFPAVTHMCIHLYKAKIARTAIDLINNLPSLEYLMLTDVTLEKFAFSNLTKFKKRSSLKLLIMNWQNCSIPIFDEMQEHDIRYLNLAKREAIWTIPNINFSKKAERMLTAIGMKTLEKQVHMANFPISICCLNYNSKNFDTITSLSIGYCTIAAYEEINKVGYKRIRLDRSIFQDLALCNLEELDIWRCSKNEDLKFLLNEQQFHSIQSYTKLKMLTLDNIPTSITGSFLTPVFTSCTQLHTVRLKSKGFNTNINNSLFYALKYTKSLKNLRIECMQISVDRFLEAIPRNSLHTLFLSTNHVSTFSEKVLHNFLEVNPQLKLLYVRIIEGIAASLLDQICKRLREKYSHIAKQIVIQRNLKYNTRNFPGTYVHDILDYKSKIKDINFYSMDWLSCD